MKHLLSMKDFLIRESLITVEQTNTQFTDSNNNDNEVEEN